MDTQEKRLASAMEIIDALRNDHYELFLTESSPPTWVFRHKESKDCIFQQVHDQYHPDRIRIDFYPWEDWRHQEMFRISKRTLDKLQLNYRVTFRANDADQEER